MLETELPVAELRGAGSVALGRAGSGQSWLSAALFPPSAWGGTVRSGVTWAGATAAQAGTDG